MYDGSRQWIGAGTSPQAMLARAIRLAKIAKADPPAEVKPEPVKVAEPVVVEAPKPQPKPPRDFSKPWFWMVNDPTTRKVNIAIIQVVVADHYGVERRDLLSARRTAKVVRPRQVAMYLAKNLTLRSLPEIGRAFGGRDHSTVLHAVRKIAALRETDAAVSAELDEIEARLKLHFNIEA